MADQLSEPAPDQPLRGRTIAVSESRELDIFAAMLEKRGAAVLRYPLLAIRDAPDPAPVLAWLRAFCAGSCDDLILYTGEGLRRLLGALARHAPELRGEFIAALQRARKIARGPKPVRALREVGLKPEFVADPATTEGVIELLKTLDLRGRTVGVQLYGSESNAALMEYLAGGGARVLPVWPYVYMDEIADAKVLELIERLAHGDADALALTSKQQVERLFEIAERAGKQALLEAGLARTLVAAVGPVVMAALSARGITACASPPESYFMKPLTQLIVEKLSVTRV